MGKRAREPSAAELPASSPAADAPLWWHVSEDEWYQQTIDHWSQQSGLNGVLGGCSEIDSLDAEGSLAFLSESVQQSPQQPSPQQQSPQQQSPQQQSPQQQLFASSHALECGAGVGRVTSSVLLHVTQSVHLVEVRDRTSLSSLGVSPSSAPASKTSNHPRTAPHSHSYGSSGSSATSQIRVSSDC